MVDTCSFCKQDIDSDDKLYKSPCGYLLHHQCVHGFLESKKEIQKVKSCEMNCEKEECCDNEQECCKENCEKEECCKNEQECCKENCENEEAKCVE